MTRKTLIAVLVCVPVLLALAWLGLRRGDIGYDTLKASYALGDSRFVSLEGGLDIHFTDTGPRDGSVIVLVHGFSSSLHTWARWKSGLEHDYRVITLDLPGHGLSHAGKPDETGIEHYVDTLHAFLQAVGVERFTLAGHSMGGNIAWNHALKYPQTLDGLILVAASGWPRDENARKGDPFIFRVMRQPFLRAILRDLDVTPMIRSGLEASYVDQQFVTDELVARHVDLARAPGHRQALLTLMNEARMPASADRLAMINLPTLILWGRADALVPVQDADKFAAVISRSRLVIHDDVGHFPQEEAATQSLAAVKVFMRDVEWLALPEETIAPQGDPRLRSDR